MKTIDIKSLLIGTLLTATIFLGIAATGQTDKWDDKQQWEVKKVRTVVQLFGQGQKTPAGWEPVSEGDESYITVRRRIK